LGGGEMSTDVMGKKYEKGRERKKGERK
jgi:hypothetical protein